MRLPLQMDRVRHQIHAPLWILVSAWLLSAISKPVAPPAEVAPVTSTRNSWAEESATTERKVIRPDTQSLRLRQNLLQELGVLDWHERGRKGKGVKVAILDSGFRGYRDFLGSVLPASVQVRSFRRDGNLEARESQHGILCGEIVHALAPEADLLLANWEPDQPERFLAALHWVREQGAKVITCSVIMPGWSDGRGNGSIHAEMQKILGDGTNLDDPLCFACAGNLALRHWSGPFRDNGQGFHLWREGVTVNEITPWSDHGAVSVELTHAPDTDFALQVLDAETREEVGLRIALPVRGVASVAVRFQPTDGKTYSVRVKRLRGEKGEFRLVVLGGSLEYHDCSGSVAFPADGSAMIAVGAVTADGQRASYSACGYDESKPELVARVPFPSVWRSLPFSGTSAAAPQAAGIAALCWSHYPQQTAQQIKKRLYEACLDLLTPGRDPQTGWGLLRMPPFER